MKNLIVDKPERIDDDIEDFKFDAIDHRKNLTSARIRVCRDPVHLTPTIFYTQELIRNFKNIDDPMARRHIIKCFSPDKADAAADVALECKFNDAILAHRDVVDAYSPLTDIHSDEMNLFIDEESATYLSDVGIDIEIQSVEATPFMLEIADGTMDLKRQLADIESKLNRVKRAMVDELEIDINCVNIDNEDEFESLISQHRLPDELVQKYLQLMDHHHDVKAQLDQANDAVFNETKTKIKLPAMIHGL